MTTPRDLLIVAMDMGPGRAVDQGGLSLTLAGAELLDLLRGGAVGLDGVRVLPGEQPVAGDDPLLREAASSLVRQEPYESVEDWLWRRGRGLAAAYEAAFEAEGQLTRPHRRLASLRPSAGPAVLAESPARTRAEARWAAREPVLVALAEAAGMDGEPWDESEEDTLDITDDGVATVLAAVNDAVMELEAVRQRRAIEDAAFDNVWRGGV
ncbi:GOLPH3/VPS74 family protein [Streptomyces sp. NPDC004082]|uniref:GOLPH3/VPS74 family protein n=1 Tax=unclassified Streptomyces TaxID=2593676 RepID=UPI0033B6EFB8